MTTPLNQLNQARLEAERAGDPSQGVVLLAEAQKRFDSAPITILASQKSEINTSIKGILSRRAEGIFEGEERKVAAEPALRKLDSLRSMRLFSSPVTRHRYEDARQRALARMDVLERAAAVEIFDSLFAKAQGGHRPHASRVDCCSIVLNCLEIVRKRVISVTYRICIGHAHPILVVKLHLSGVELPTRDASRRGIDGGERAVWSWTGVVAERCDRDFGDRGNGLDGNSGASRLCARRRRCHNTCAGHHGDLHGKHR